MYGTYSKRAHSRLRLSCCRRGRFQGQCRDLNHVRRKQRKVLRGGTYTRCTRQYRHQDGPGVDTRSEDPSSILRRDKKVVLFEEKVALVMFSWGQFCGVRMASASYPCTDVTEEEFVAPPRPPYVPVSRGCPSVCSPTRALATARPCSSAPRCPPAAVSPPRVLPVMSA
jgi:hypothetical protein